MSEGRAEWKAYTQQDDDQIIDLRYRQHLSVAKIGKILGRRHASINTRLYNVALLARIPEDLAQEVQATLGIAKLEQSPTPPPPRVADRPDVVQRKVTVSSFWKQREVNITLPRLHCLEEPIEA